ncbi:MAG: hypothetical protein KKF79_05360 [Gammaproteobacteria bacterium]|nr:hypothetical protein [Gammaproteobacteria bacterium]MBU2280626.1 hypothetical protein [Gammaproteobacteria bacterium]
MSAFSEKHRFNRISVNFRFWHKVTFQPLFCPVKRAGGLAGFEVLSRGDRNAHCLSNLTLANRELVLMPQNRDKLPGFIRASLCPSDQLKLFNIAPAMLWRSKRKIIAIGETLF